MKYITALLAALSITAFAAEEKRVESIVYSDGDVYTVKENDHVFIVGYDNLYLQQVYPKSTQFLKQWPTARVDRPEAPVNPNPIGTQEWCAAHIPFANGFTFSDQAWQRECDTNRDGEYNQCDYYQPTGAATFEEGAWQDLCNDGQPWDGQ